MKISITRSFYALFVLLFSLWLLPHGTVYAAGEFQADYDVQYAVAPSGTTIVTQNVTLTNNQTNFYPQKYSITIDSEKITNVIAFDDIGLVTPDITQLNGKTNILLTFNDHAVGLSKQLHFSLRYENGDIAHQIGKIWEVNIPGVPKDPDLVSYSVSLSVPPTFGPNAYMSPPPDSTGKWSKEQMVNGGISAAYGTQQVFSFDLTYFIQNTSIVPKSTEIALPPDTAYQHVRIANLDPKPRTVVQDGDGNWLAQYDLLPAQTMTIHARAIVLLTLTPRAGLTEPLPDPSVYTRPLKYWESGSEQIKLLAQQYKTPRDIYNFVTHALTYDYMRVNGSAQRRGALGALANSNSAICMEFTDLFIAIARAANIPAREAVGYAYTTNPKLRPLSLVSDVLHAWPEYYDYAQKVWVPVDPTWGNTTGGVDYFDKLDYNHTVFAINGVESDYPYPAGVYKQSGSHTKDVMVQFADVVPDFQPQPLSVNYYFPSVATSGFTANGSVIVQNPSGVSAPSSTVTIQSSPFDVAIDKTIGILPPFAAFSIPIRIPLPGYFLQTNGSITTTIGGQIFRFIFTVTPLWYKFSFSIICFGAILLIILVACIRQILLWKIQKKH